MSSALEDRNVTGRIMEVHGFTGTHTAQDGTETTGIKIRKLNEQSFSQDEDGRALQILNADLLVLETDVSHISKGDTLKLTTKGEVWTVKESPTRHGGNWICESTLARERKYNEPRKSDV